MAASLQIAGRTYLRKVGFLWGPIEGFPADVADDSNVIRFYQRKDLAKVLRDPQQLRALITAAVSSRQKIPYATAPKSIAWTLEVDGHGVGLAFPLSP